MESMQQRGGSCGRASSGAMWDRYALIDELLGHYDKLDEDLRDELPLKLIWTVAVPEEES